MPTSNFSQFQQSTIKQLSADIDSLFTTIRLPSPLQDACKYAMKNGGKRVRPLLVASSFASILSDTNVDTLSLSSMARRAMMAVELLHAYSLVHDDLPCMDDDALRRGRPTCHIAFDEATAMLTGDVLQTLAFEVLTADLANFTPPLPIAEQETVAKLLATFAPRARRMVAGQMLDLNGESKNLTQTKLQAVHEYKTGALIEAAVLMGAICANASNKQLTDLQNFAQNLGLAFQVQDDILDVTANTEQLGKPSGSDEKLNKSTYVKLMGVNKAQDYAKSLFEQSKAYLNAIGNTTDASQLHNLADWLWQRQH
ncbi:MAG: farnesyl-diphosphate synthase [Gammaproteobacteria bacterium]|nr:MAG: farnesyl-diphosphate synthase [Gammaproteobacteria bacterium]